MLVYAITNIANWETQNAELLAGALVETVAIEPLSWYEFRTVVIEEGGSRAELAGLYDTGGFFDELKSMLETGNYDKYLALRDDAGDVVVLSAATKSAIVAVINGRKIRLIDEAAAISDESAPETVTAANVTSALSAAGYTWSGSAWG